MSEQHILFCQCEGHAVVPADVMRDVLAGLAAGPAAFTAVTDLCGRCAARDAALQALAERATTLTVVACHARAVRWLLHAAGVRIPAGGLRVLDMRTLTAAAILEQLAATGPDVKPDAGPDASWASSAPAADDWPPWFPVIDYDRCRQCRQCLSFCLFGVYALSPEGRVVVANPRSCKNNCPACSRICPEVAIMFPKLAAAEAPLNGDEVRDEAGLKARARVNVQEILGDNVYAALAERRRQSQARRLRRPAVAQAEHERAVHLAGSAPAAAAQTGADGSPSAPAGV